VTATPTVAQIQSPLAQRFPASIPLLVAGAFFMEMLDGTIIATAIPQMAQSFRVHPIDLNLGMTAYMIMLAAGIPLSGWAAERFGARRVFASAILIFTLASVLCGIATGFWWFFAARVIQGVGGALMVPVGRLLVLRSTPKRDLMRATAFITWPALVAPILGPVVGGVLTTYASWRWIFFINLPLGLIGLVATLLLLSSGRSTEARRLDWTGVILSASAAIAFVYGASLLGTANGNVPVSLGLMLLGAIGAVATARHAARHPAPLMEFSALRIRSFATTLWSGSTVRIAINVAPFLLPLLFQIGFHRSAVASGSLLLFLFAGNLGIKPLTSPLLRRFGFRSVLIVNGLILAATFAGFAWLSPATPLWLLLPLLILSGATRSMQFTAINTLAYAEVPPASMTSANTLFNLGQQVSVGLGIAFGAVMLRLGPPLLGSTSLSPGAFQFAFLATALLCALPTLDFWRLAPNAGAEVSRHRR
jgi:EmrB/QacA subfamily drug resistance transporter